MVVYVPSDTTHKYLNICRSNKCSNLNCQYAVTRHLIHKAFMFTWLKVHEVCIIIIIVINYTIISICCTTTSFLLKILNRK